MPKFNQVVCLDYETYYSKDYSLTKMSTSAYVRDPQFKVHMMGIRFPDGRLEVCVSDAAIRAALQEVDWTRTALLAQNTPFDGFILTQHYGVTPAYYMDSLAAARGLYPHLGSHSLDALAKYFRMPGKMEGRLQISKNKRDLTDLEIELLAEYCEHDVELCWKIYDQHMSPSLPAVERDLIDLTTRLFCEPLLEIDIERADEVIKSEVIAKHNALTAALEPQDFKAAMLGNTTATDALKDRLMSNDQFASALAELGVDPPRKISKVTGKEAWAFAKTDQGLKDLLEHPRPEVKALAAARLRIKSTLNETRATRFVEEGKVGRFPVGLRYYGAHTGRWSGTNKLNLQNLPRGGELRRSLLAPAGHVVVVADSGQIEARVTAWLAGQTDLLDDFRAGIDVYSKFASVVYGRPITKADVTERFVGKTCVLGLGFGMGAERLQTTLKNGGVYLPLDECDRLVKIYRKVYSRIQLLWRDMDRMIGFMAGNGATNAYVLKPPTELDYKVLTFKPNHVVLPNDMAIVYPALYYEEADGVRLNARYRDPRGGWIDLYGAKLVENLVQALARIIVAEQMLIIAARYRVVTMSHDEIVIVAPEDESDASLKFMLDTMSTPPAWCADIPLSAEGGYDTCYSK